jgi:hypothetical protein
VQKRLGGRREGAPCPEPDDAPAESVLLLRLDIRGLLALRAGGDVEHHALVLRQGLEAGRIDCREVGEQIVAAIIRFDEAGLSKADSCGTPSNRPRPASRLCPTCALYNARRSNWHKT